MAAYSRVYDSRHLQADCQEWNPMLGSRVWATFFVGCKGERSVHVVCRVEASCHVSQRDVGLRG